MAQSGDNRVEHGRDRLPIAASWLEGPARSHPHAFLLRQFDATLYIIYNVESVLRADPGSRSPAGEACGSANLQIVYNLGVFILHERRGISVSPLTRQRMNSMGTKQQTLEGFLREAIARGDLKPGTRLKQQELARQFGVSPTPVRETLRRLEGDGLVLYMPNRGISVARVDFPEVKEIYMMRMVLEGLAVENALASEPDLEALHRLQERMDRATTQNRLKAVRNLNYDFHMMIYRLSGYKRLLQFIQALWGLTPWDTVQVIPGRARASMREHHGILEAFRTGNKSQAASRMRTHISHSFAALKTYLSGKTRRSRLGRAHTKNRK